MAIADTFTYFVLIALVLGLMSLPAFRLVDAALRVRDCFVALDGLCARRRAHLGWVRHPLPLLERTGSTAALCAGGLVVASSNTYLFVELPGIRFGKRVARRPTTVTPVAGLPVDARAAGLSTLRSPVLAATADQCFHRHRPVLHWVQSTEHPSPAAAQPLASVTWEAERAWSR
jgi:hypothetical protein